MEASSMYESILGDLRQYWNLLPNLELGRHLLKIDLIRFLLCQARFRTKINNGGKVKVFQGGEHVKQDINGETTALYNLQAMQGDFSSARSSRLIRPLSCLEMIFPKRKNNRSLGVLSDIDTLSDAKVLAVGPRNEAELFLLHAYGFDLKNITGIDLLSYSDMIDCGDMHNLPYADNTFDVIICSCTLCYSENPKLVCTEFDRVLKNNGVCAIMHDICGRQSKEKDIARYGYPMYSPEDTLNLFNKEARSFDVYWRHFPEEYVDEGETGVTSSIIFRIKKN